MVGKIGFGVDCGGGVAGGWTGSALGGGIVSTLRGVSGGEVGVEVVSSPGWTDSAGMRAGGRAGDVRMVVRRTNASWWLSVRGANGDPGDGWCSACKMSRTPARMRSLDDASGIFTLVGNQMRVSHNRVARVSHSHTV